MLEKPLGILGGTFDPVHYGHLRIALECYETLGLAGIRFIPVYSPPHRRAAIASPEQRLAMLRLAIENRENFIVDDREIIRGGISYTINTLQELCDEMAGQPICLIMGMDAFQTLNTWYKWELILDHVHIIVTDRPGSEPEIKQTEIKTLFDKLTISDPADLSRQSCGLIFRIRFPMLDISATRIRHLISQELDISYLVPDRVIDYIKQENLYKAK